jgi:hypothetical protein
VVLVDLWAGLLEEASRLDQNSDEVSPIAMYCWYGGFCVANHSPSIPEMIH